MCCSHSHSRCCVCNHSALPHTITLKKTEGGGGRRHSTRAPHAVRPRVRGASSVPRPACSPLTPSPHKPLLPSMGASASTTEARDRFRPPDSLVFTMTEGGDAGVGLPVPRSLSDSDPAAGSVLSPGRPAARTAGLEPREASPCAGTTGPAGDNEEAVALASARSPPL